MVIALCVFALAWGALSVLLGVRRWTMPLGVRAGVTAGMMPVVGVALWATGGASSYLQPVLLFTALFVGWFFPPRLAWPLVVLFLATYASPLGYDARRGRRRVPGARARLLVAVIGQTFAMQFLKRASCAPSCASATIAELDPLTGVSNRRGFDHALARAQESGERYALVLFDFDDFKAINDEHGHPTGRHRAAHRRARRPGRGAQGRLPGAHRRRRVRGDRAGRRGDRRASGW